VDDRYLKYHHQPMYAGASAWTIWLVRPDPEAPDDPKRYHFIRSLGGYFAEADARRAVACLNAYRGVKTEHLERGFIEDHA
jgi:hypothetical protein